MKLANIVLIHFIVYLAQQMIIGLSQIYGNMTTMILVHVYALIGIMTMETKHVLVVIIHGLFE